MSGEASKRTFLLVEEPANVAEPPLQAATPAATSTSADEHYARFRRRFIILTSVSIFLSAVVFASSTAMEIMIPQFVPWCWYLEWITTDMNRYMIATTVATAFIGFLNLVRLYNENRPHGLLFNIICDVVFVFYLGDNNDEEADVCLLQELLGLYLLLRPAVN
ncbi:hypothetical protein PISL3812_05261 [Talaromyces islandicus]|uniref:Transmembrane protein n=1 Tax=Talaromyces islandicus TaxID=28573 RepID=A0A0U1LXZ0_TALIS|nr:hypothetical protein PISL3812_05261 [Talaromyces islandicus]